MSRPAGACWACRSLQRAPAATPYTDRCKTSPSRGRSFRRARTAAPRRWFPRSQAQGSVRPSRCNVSTQSELLQVAIDSLEAQRALIGDAVVDAALTPLRASLAALDAAPQVPGHGATQTLKQVTRAVSRRRRLHDAEPAPRPRGHPRRDGRRAGQLHRASSNSPPRQGAAVRGRQRCWPCSAPMKCAKTMPSAPCTPAWRCSPKRGARASRSQRQHGHAGFDVRVGVHTGQRAARRRRRRRGQHPRHDGQHCRAHGADRSRRRGAHQPRHLRSGARPVRRRGAAADRWSMASTCPSSPTWCMRARPRAFRRDHARRRGRRDAHGRARRRAARLQRAFAALFGAAPIRAPSRRGARPGSARADCSTSSRSWARRAPNASQVFQGPRPRADREPAIRPAARPAGPAAPDRRQRQHGAAKREIRTRRCALVRADDGARHGARPRPCAGPPDRAGLSRTAGTCSGILDDGRQIRSRALHAAAQILRRIAAATAHPLCCCWKTCTGPTTGRWTSSTHLAKLNHDVPMLVLASTRPDAVRTTPGLGRDESIHERIHLEPLDALQPSRIGRRACCTSSARCPRNCSIS